MEEYSLFSVPSRQNVLIGAKRQAYRALIVGVAAQLITFTAQTEPTSFGVATSYWARLIQGTPRSRPDEEEKLASFRKILDSHLELLTVALRHSQLDDELLSEADLILISTAIHSFNDWNSELEMIIRTMPK